jgi:hypothetical protein
MYCKVKFCKYPESHTTLGHFCKNCFQYGHGYIECGNQQEIDKLRDYDLDEMSIVNQCKFINCKNPKTHSCESHHCQKCHLRHDEKTCLIKSKEEYIIDIDNELLQSIENYEKKFNQFINSYMKIEYNQTIIFIRKINNLNIDIMEISQFDSCYQYLFNIFTKNLYFIGNFIGSEKTLNCPICRTHINKNNVFEIKGLNEKCNICFENNINLYFKSCNHAIICNICFDKLDNDLRK